MRILAALVLLQGALSAVLGVDYGQDSTKGFLVAPNAPFEIVLTGDARRKDASGLTFKPTGENTFERILGSAGYSSSTRFPESAFYFLKPLLGASFNSEAVKEFQELHPGLHLVRTDRDSVAFEVGTQTYPVEQLVAMQFIDVQRRATDTLHQRTKTGVVKDVAVSVPGFYTTAQRLALEEAISLSSLELIALVNDGVAVASNYATSRRKFSPEKEYFVVYDMGAGSTTSTLVSICSLEGSNNQIEVEGFAADKGLGGSAITQRIREFLVKSFVESAHLTGPEALAAPRLQQRLWKEAERVKSVLSANKETSIFMEDLYDEKDLSARLSREQLEELCADLAKRVTQPLEAALTTFEGETVGLENLAGVLLTGGGMRVPFVQAQIRGLVGDLIQKNVNADESAALGTTLRGVAISGIFRTRNLQVIDRSPTQFNLKLENGTVDLFPRGSVLGSNVTKTFALEKDQKEISFELVENNETVAEYTIAPKVSGFDRTQCGTPPIATVLFKLTNSNIVKSASVNVKCEGIPAKEGEKGELIIRYLSPRISYKGTARMSSATKHKLVLGIRELDQQDDNRVHRQSLQNNLETLLYRIRELAPEEPVVEEMLAFVEEGSGTIAQLTERLNEAKRIYKQYTVSTTTASEESSQYGGDGSPETPKPPPVRKEGYARLPLEIRQSLEADNTPEQDKNDMTALITVFLEVGADIPTSFENSDWLTKIIDAMTVPQLRHALRLATETYDMGKYRDTFIYILNKALDVAHAHDEL